MKSLSVIIPYRRNDLTRQILIEQLLFCLKAQTMQEFELIVVEDTMGRGMSTIKNSRIDRVVATTDPKYRGFNKSWCINVGINKAKCDNIIVLDADILVGKEYLEKVLEFKAQNDVFTKTGLEFFHGYDWIVLLPGKDNPITRVMHHKDISSTGGSWFTTKSFFWNRIGGMNENYFGYGREDSDLWNRVDYITISPILNLPYPLTHQYHDWEVKNGSHDKIYQKNCLIWHYTKDNTKDVIRKLKKTSLGKLEGPTLIDIGI